MPTTIHIQQENHPVFCPVLVAEVEVRIYVMHVSILIVRCGIILACSSSFCSVTGLGPPVVLSSESRPSFIRQV